MTDVGTPSPQLTLKPAAERRKPARKSQPRNFPNRLSVGFADDQLATLQQIKTVYRASESFVIRMAFDVFARTNGFPVNNGGGTNGR
jgi:hypothetical protein